MKRLFVVPILCAGIGLGAANNTEVDIVIKSMSMSKFCKTKTIICPGDVIDSEKYNGMPGKLVVEPVGEEFRKKIYQIKMDDGSVLYYERKGDDFFSKNSGLVKLSSHVQTLEDEGKSVVDGSSIVIERIELDSSGIGYKYYLSTGNEIWGDQFKVLRLILPYIPTEHEVEFMAILDNLNIKYDDMEERFFISIKEDYDLSNIERLSILPYIGLNKDRSWLRFRLYYTADKWLFANRVLIKTDDKKKTYEGISFERDHSGRRIWEWFDKAADEEDIQLIREVISSENTALRFYGKQYYNDRKISDKQKQLLKNILWLYEIFQNKT